MAPHFSPRAGETGPIPDQADSSRTLGVIFLARIALNLQLRLVYPFLPAISRGLGVPLETASLLLTVRSLVGTSSPVYGLLADRYGRRVVMLAGLTALVLGAVAMGIAPMFAIALGAFALLGLSKASYDPAMQAYIGDAVPYARRGRVMGILELPWALSWLVGVPIAGFLISLAGWRSPFWLTAGLGTISLLATWLLCPTCGRSSPTAFPATGTTSTETNVAAHPTETTLVPNTDRYISGSKTVRPLWSELLPHLPKASRPALMALSITCLLMLASDNVFVVYGAWMETQFGLAVSTLGLVSIVIGLAELGAESSSAGLVDRLGKRRAVLGGLLLNFLAYLVLPQLARNLGGALVGIALMILTFEFSIVSMIPLVSELMPSARGTIMALNVAAISFGRMISSLMGPRLWALGGLKANALVSAGVVLLAALILWRGVREGQS